MQVFLGDTVTLIKNDTWITGQVRGIVLDEHKQVERVYMSDIEGSFWMKDGWKFTEETEYEEEEEEDEI